MSIRKNTNPRPLDLPPEMQDLLLRNGMHTMPRGYRRIFTMKRHEVEFPLKHPRHVIENTAYKDSVYRIMAWRHPWIKIARSFEELALNLRYGNFTIIWQTLQKRIRKWTKQDRHL